MTRSGTPAGTPAGKAVHSGRGRIPCRILPGVLVVFFAACNMHPVSRSLTRYGYLDTAGRVLIEAQFKDARQFSEGLAAVEVDGRWGYIDRNRQIAIRPQFHKAKAFRHGRALVEVSPDSSRYIDRMGKVAAERMYQEYLRPGLSEGLAESMSRTRTFRVSSRRGSRRQGKIQRQQPLRVTPIVRTLGFHRPAGTFDVDLISSRLQLFGGSRRVRVRNPNAGIRRAGCTATSTVPALLCLHRNSKPHLISPTALRGSSSAAAKGLRQDRRRVTEATFDDAKTSRGACPVRIGDRWGYIDKTGKIAIPAEFTTAGRFSEGRAAASRSGKLGGYIDRAGTMVISEQFGVAWPFSDGLARVKIGDGSGLSDRWGYIDRSGKVVISRSGKEGWPFSEGRALFGNGGPI